MAMMRTRTKSRGMCLCLLGIALALLVQPSTDFARGVPGLKDSMLAKRHPLHAGVARRAGAAQEDNSAEDRLDLEEVISEAERVLSATKKDMQVVMRKVQLTDPGKWNDLATKPELKQQLKKFVAEAKAALKALEEDLLLARLQQASAQRQVETAQQQVEMVMKSLVKAAARLEKAEESGTKEEVKEAKEEVKEAKEEVEKAERKVEKAERKVERAKKEVQAAERKEAKASGRTKESEEHVEKLVKKFAGAEYWARPTPRFGKYVRGERLTWPGTDLPCPGELPNASRTDDGRTTAFGIGNAFGTGKTEVAIRSAEMTCAAEPGLRVAYISFSNGYKSKELADSVEDNSSRAKRGSQVLGCSKYCGLWLMAGMRATRVIDNEVQGNARLFQGIVAAYMGNPQWKLPGYVEQTDAKLIVILDEVQEFAFGTLEGLVSMIVVPSKTRMSLVVGAFSPSFLNPSGNRLRDVRLPVLAQDDMEQIFQDRIPGAQINFEGVSLPGLFGGCVRPLASWSSAKEELGMNQDPTQSCLRQYETSSYWTTAGLVQAAVADVPICSEMLKTAFMQDSLSLGAAFVLPKDRHFLVSLPPLQIAAGQFELPTEIDKGTQRKVRDILTGFCSPTWTQFEELTGIAPALRVAALSQSNMGLILGGHTVLQHVFGSEASNTKAQELLRQNVREDLAVRWVRGGTDVAAVNFSQLSCDAGEKELLTIGMAADHNSNFDHFLIVPLDNGEKLLFCLDAKFSVEGMEKDLNFEQDIQPKLKGFSAMNLPTSWHTLVLIVSNRRITEGQAIRVQNFAEAPLIAAGAEHLQRVLSCSLVPPAYRERRRKKQS
ncbi:unnamed protein product [Effrenium voratum]|uniref:Uncharacterized protein n=1 Tax=Effrenium voratum TaxID=2562239 RepID=A0AA36ICE7_9DINO|nr:unnamed protein product [Effrenium voratum]